MASWWKNRQASVVTGSNLMSTRGLAVTVKKTATSRAKSRIRSDRPVPSDGTPAATAWAIALRVSDRVTTVSMAGRFAGSQRSRVLLRATGNWRVQITRLMARRWMAVSSADRVEIAT